jgi:RNA polymerase sigma factor (sigma-70 family)
MRAGDRFPTTRWSAIVGARAEDERERRRSWEALAAAYWKPAYKHVRIKWKQGPEEAADLIQAFFERAMQKDFFSTYDAEVARFRTFFRTCLDRFASNAAKAESRLKRGGGVEFLSFEFDAAESELAKAGAAASPEECFDREWRRSVFSIAIETLRAECLANGKETAFRLFERYDLADGERPTYEDLARELRIPVTTVTNHLAYARRELRRIALQKLEALTASRQELRAEAKLLLGVDVG